MAKRRKRKPPTDDTPKRHCPKCGTRIVYDKHQRPWIMVWAYRWIAGGPCLGCGATALPADHWHAGCQHCGHRWTEHDGQPVDSVGTPEV